MSPGKRPRIAASVAAVPVSLIMICIVICLVSRGATYGSRSERIWIGVVAVETQESEERVTALFKQMEQNTQSFLYESFYTQ